MSAIASVSFLYETCNINLTLCCLCFLITKFDIKSRKGNTPVPAAKATYKHGSVNEKFWSGNSSPTPIGPRTSKVLFISEHKAYDRPVLLSFTKIETYSSKV